MAIDFGGMFEGLLGGYGYKELMDRQDDLSGDIQGQLKDLTGQIGQKTQFQPWGVTNAIGSTQYGPEGMTGTLSDPMQAWSNTAMSRGGLGMLNAMMPNAQREQQVYDRMMAVQQPTLDRMNSQMMNQSLAAGRQGMFTNQYGGSPEQHAQAMAQAEAQNQAALGAMTQAQAEALQQYNMGQGLLAEGWKPYDQMRADQGLGLNFGQLAQHGQLQGANLLAQLGLGGIGTQVNLENIRGGMFGDMIKALAPVAGGIGDAASGTLNNAVGGAWDWLKGQF